MLVSATEKTSGIGETKLGVSVADVEFDPSLEFASTEFFFGVEPKLGQISEMGKDSLRLNRNVDLNATGMTADCAFLQSSRITHI